MRYICAILMVAVLSACSPLQYWPLDGSAPVTFNADSPDAALVLYHDRATVRGWSPEEISEWEPFLVYDVMPRESRWCPNVRGGAVLEGDGVGCIIAKQGNGSDSGIGQVLMGYPKRRGWYWPMGGGTWKLHEHASWLCPAEGFCTPDQVIDTPEHSMDALLALVERAGKSPWCYKESNGWHPTCSTAPRNFPNQN